MEQEKSPWVARALNEARRAWLARPRSHGLLVLLSALLASSSLAVGLQLDDHIQRTLVRDGEVTRLMWGEPPGRFDLFRFIDGDPEDRRASLESGVSPWYASPRVRLAFARPLAAATHVLDYSLLDPWPALMHVHSLLWLLALGWAVLRVARRLESGWALGLTLLFYLLDASHGVPAGWLANRNALMAGTFGALALDAHIAWRVGERRSCALSLALATLGLLSGESMLSWCGFFFAYALCLDARGAKRGLLAITPLAALVVAWRVAYRTLGYGASGSALYIDPALDPLRFAGAVLERLPQLLVSGIGGPPPGFVSLGGRQAELIAAALSILALAGASVVLWRRLRHDRLAAFWALGAVCAAVPVCAAQPHARLMLAAGLGVAGVVARFLVSLVEGPPAARLPRALGAFWLVLLGLLSPLRLPVEAYSPVQVGRPNQLAADSFPPEAAGQTLVVIGAPDPMFMCAGALATTLSLGRPAPARLRCLAGVESEAEVLREDAQTLVVRVPEGLLSAFFVHLLRDASDPLPLDWSLELSDVRFEIAERDSDGTPLALRARFRVPLSDASLHFVTWSPERRAFVPFALPPVGERVSVRGESILDVMFGR